MWFKIESPLTPHGAYLWACGHGYTPAFLVSPLGSSLNYTANMSNSISSQSVRSSQKRRERRLPKDAEKVLDAPGLVDDYCKYILVLVY